MVVAGRFAVARRALVPPFHVMKVVAAIAERTRTHGDVISLAAGQPAGAAPEPVLRAAERALRAGSLGYTEPLGIRPLREALAGHYQRRYQLTVDPDEVVVTTGSSGAFLLAFLSAFNAGDRVALARPGYPAYRNILTALGCEVVELPCGPDTRFQPTVAMLDALDEPVHGLIVASPANPTGTVLDATALGGLATWCDRRGVRLISDEIYHGVGYDGPLPCAWETNRDAIIINSFSKYFAMTGWRLGWMLLPARLRAAVDALTGNLTLCPPTLAQHAAVAAFTDEAYATADAEVRRYRVNRDLLVSGLRELGVDRIAPPDGAFYVYADISHLTDDTMSWCQDVLAETGVAVVPGVDFDPVDGARSIRMSFAGATADIERALIRLRKRLSPGS